MEDYEYVKLVHILNILRNLGPLGLDTMVSDHGTSVDILDGVPPVLKPVTSTKYKYKLSSNLMF